ncbi:uncharacterized protein EI97DRAFT_438484 [Westerdykella ornata]|uniref:BZIP transcription factor n=1 Tax=Westerdykella ornata TaxID=318751 RepID=A0A6A6JWU6_WESOR|nr:uncharacterized protein EI97DRAFT_438484 [Westerdykella ornata]KAF2281082.1 hypothetical protein EI97DRAFT_438484 [Westerdykella ornata]
MAGIDPDLQPGLQPDVRPPENPEQHGDAVRTPDSSSTVAPTSSTQKRRRTGGAAPRGVAHLTPEQLARKRANDREAQRAIRERTKNQIDSLNRRIHELESQQPYHDLQVVVREKEAIQAENADIRTRLESVLAIIQPILQRTSNGLNELAAAAERNSLPIAPAQRETALPSHIARPLHSGLVSPQNGIASPAGTDSSRQWLYAGDAPASHVRRWSGDSPQYDPTRPQTTAVQPGTPFDERLGVDFLLDNGHRRVDPSLPPPPPHSHPASTPLVGQHAPCNLLPHLILPRTLPATCPLDDIMLNFLSERQARASEGVPSHILSGPPYPNFTALVYPRRQVESHPLSKLFTDIIRTFPDISGLPEQVAVVYVMFLVMRWQIEPTQENYERLPDWVTPRPSQLFIPHPYWINHLPWPGLRDRVVAEQATTPFDSFFIPFTTTLSLNWPYDPTSCLIRNSNVQPLAPAYPTTAPSARANGPTASQRIVQPGGPSSPIVLAPEEEQWVINPEFERHIRDLSNWSLGPAFRTAFPNLAKAVKIKELR